MKHTRMSLRKRLLVVAMILWALGVLGVGMATVALASCTTTTIFTSDGRMVICTTCCIGTNCTVNCI